MITLTRLSGSVFVLNSDLIERIDSAPDTVITLVDGTKYVVAEAMHDVVDAVISYRNELISFSSAISDDPPADRAGGQKRRLAAVSHVGDDAPRTGARDL